MIMWIKLVVRLSLLVVRMSDSDKRNEDMAFRHDWFLLHS